MTRTRPALFTRSGRPFVCAGLLIFTASLAQGGEATAKNTVFKSDAGEAWTVSIKPAGRVAKAETRSLPVPSPVDVSQVVALVQEPAQPPADLPPVPAINNPDSGVRTAHGVTVSPDPVTDMEAFGRRYQEAYKAIRFNRAEYDANPSYRHEAAMELVFGQMRPTTVVKQMGAPSVDPPAAGPYQPYLPSAGDLYPWRTGRLRNPIFEPQFVAPNLVPSGCYWPGF